MIRLELKPAHKEAYEEDITSRCTNRLFKKASECYWVATPPLPTMSVWVTGEALSWWSRDWYTWPFPRWTAAGLSTPARWELDRYGKGWIGRKGRRLSVRFYIEWQMSKSKNYQYPSRTEEGEFGRHHVFTTNIEIFPLTTQQALLVGTKKIPSKLSTIFWGTKADVEEIESKFPYARGSAA